jgi:hypothetical protein
MLHVHGRKPCRATRCLPWKDDELTTLGLQSAARWCHFSSHTRNLPAIARKIAEIQVLGTERTLAIDLKNWKILLCR